MLYLSPDALQAELDYRYPARSGRNRVASSRVRRLRAPKVARPRRDRRLLVRRAVA